MLMLLNTHDKTADMHFIFEYSINFIICHITLSYSIPCTSIGPLMSKSILKGAVLVNFTGYFPNFVQKRMHFCL